MNDTGQYRDGSALAFEAAFFRLQAAIDGACRIERIGAPAPDWPAQAAAAIRAAFEWAAANPEAANLLTNKALGEGPGGIARYHRLVAFLAGLLREGREERGEAPDLPSITERALAGGLASLVAQRLDQGREDELPALAPEAIQFALTPYLGAEEARLAAAPPDA